jgi:hypothetical protein
MNSDNSIEEDHDPCSGFIRRLVQHPENSISGSKEFARMIPKRIVQFWDNFDRLPDDVGKCIETWRALEEHGFEFSLFDYKIARDFIHRNLGSRYEQAFEKCYHPAMQSDYFRLCYIFVEGGCYIDADDVYSGTQIHHLFDDGRLKIQPLCFDTATHRMVSPDIFTVLGANSSTWIVYFNNNPLIACSGNPVVEYALEQATLTLEKDFSTGLPEIQSTAGPGNLTKSIFELSTQIGKIEQTLLVLAAWEESAKSNWELGYRNDSRNWRLSNCQAYKE